MEQANNALDALQDIIAQLGVLEATKKVCRQAQTMIWLATLFDSVRMTMRIPDGKMAEIGDVLLEWAHGLAPIRRECFPPPPPPPARIFTNLMLENLREAPKRRTKSLSLGFKKNLRFFRELWQAYN